MSHTLVIQQTTVLKLICPLFLGTCMAFVDRELTCAQCGAEFVFSAGEQEFFSTKGFTHDPKRCKRCKAQNDGSRVRQRVDIPVRCAQCGRNTSVPFRPKGNRPVLCAECFKGQKVISIRQSEQ